MVVFEDALNTLEAALESEKRGNKDEADALVESLWVKLEGTIQESDKYAEKTMDVVVDRSNIPEAGFVLIENEYVVLKMISPEERQSYIAV